MVEASNGYDLPSFANFTDFKTWAEEGPPKGTLYHYPKNHQSPDPVDRGRAGTGTRSASRSTCRRCRRKWPSAHFRGEAMEKTLGWAANELEGFMRT